MKIKKIFDKSDIAYLEENVGKNILPLSLFDNKIRPGSEPLEIVIFYQKGTAAQKLAENFLKTTEYFNLFSSRLIMIGDNQFALQYCTDGVLIKILPPVDATSDTIDIHDIKKMMIHVKTLPGEPLLSVTGIPLKDGIVGAISCSHAIADGISIMLFLYAWGCIIEGQDFPLPSRQRLFKGSPVRSDTLRKAFIPPLSELDSTIQDRVKHVMNDKTYTIREYFSDEFLAEMKRKATSENATYRISGNQIMTSFLLKKYHHQMLPDADRIIVRTPINLRDVHPDVDALYIGNAYFNGFTELTKDEIDQLSVTELAYRMKESIAGMRNEAFVKDVAYLSEYGIEINMDVYKKDRPPFDIDRDISSSNLTHLNDLESLGLGSHIGRILYIGSAVQTGFTMLKEKSGRIFAEITSRYPFT